MRDWFLKKEFNGLHMIGSGLCAAALTDGKIIAAFVLVTVMAALTTWLDR